MFSSKLNKAKKGLLCFLHSTLLPSVKGQLFKENTSDLDRTLLPGVAELRELEGLERSWLREEAEVAGERWSL